MREDIYISYIDAGKGIEAAKAGTFGCSRFCIACMIRLSDKRKPGQHEFQTLPDPLTSDKGNRKRFLRKGFRYDKQVLCAGRATWRRKINHGLSAQGNGHSLYSRLHDSYFPEGRPWTDKNLEFYRSVSREELNRLDLVAQFTHKGDIYGVRKEDILGALEHHRISIMIMESSGIRQLGKFIKKNLFTVYLMADCMTLVKRMLDMSCSNEEIKYHLQYDENNHEFDNWKITDYVIKNTGTPAQAADQLLAIMGLTAVVPPDQFTRLTN